MVGLTLFPTRIGTCGIAWRNDVVVATELPGRSDLATASRLAARTGGSPLEPPDPIQRALASMTATLAGERVDLSNIPCAMAEIDAFSKRVYAAARIIPFGETTTYGAIARRLGDVRLARRVGRALACNPLPILVPCHRVIGANRRLVGFSALGGVDTKRKMLVIEGAWIDETQNLFEGLTKVNRTS